jgi:penicillin-binding protein 2
MLCDSLLEKYEFGSVVSIKPKTGEVLVLYSKPGFDPNKLVRGVSYDELKDMVVVEGASFWNRAAMSKYAPGSVFKIVVAGIALENNVIEEHTHLKPCKGWLRIGNRIFKCWKKHGRMDTYNAIVQSCDVFFYQVGMKLGFSKMEDWIRKLEILEKTNIDLPEEGEGFFPDTGWYKQKYDLVKPTPGMVANLSIGQGEVLFTPLQLCCFFSGIANGGMIYSPYLVSEIKEVSGNVVYSHKSEKKNIQFSKETIQFLKEAMLGVVNDRGGTGVLSRLPQCKVAGKTGTAENPQGEDHAWFVAFAPYEAPEICVVVQIENAGHGGSVAAPIAREIIKRALTEDK